MYSVLGEISHTVGVLVSDLEVFVAILTRQTLPLFSFNFNSGGIALCANTPAALVAANLWILVMGFIFGYFCWLIAKVCHLTGRTTYRGIWQETVGHNGSLAVSIGNTLKAAMADLAYASILSDALKSIFVGLGWQVSRVACLLLVTLVGILPLCLLKSMHVLAPFSVLGTAAIGLTTIAMLIRYLDGSYQPGGKFYNDVVAVPEFGDRNGAWGTGILPFVCMVFEAYVMHYNAPRFYTELKDRNLQKFGTAVSSSFGLSAVMYMALASVGFLTFGGSSNSFILNSYSPRDPLALLSRLLVGISTLMAYPIVFTGARDGVMDILEIPLVEQTPERIRRLTLVLLTILTVTAIFVTDLGLINAVGGGIIATAIVFVFPTMMFYGAVKQKLGGENDKKEMVFALCLTVFGVLFGVIGAYLAVAGVD